jgi:hypothetical protein
MTDKPTITEQITEYLASGGLFNPEAMEHGKVRDLLLDCRDEVKRLQEKCDKQATILRRLTPDKYPNLLFIHSTLGDQDQNNMPQKLLVVPAYGVDFSYIYERTEKTTGPEW